MIYYVEEFDGPAINSLSSVRSRQLSNVGQSLNGWPKIYYLERASEGTLSRWSRRHLQSLARTNPYWARVVGYSPFSLCVTHKEGLRPSSGDINRLMMILCHNFHRFILKPQKIDKSNYFLLHFVFSYAKKLKQNHNVLVKGELLCKQV
jgi:hypothetical protein